MSGAVRIETKLRSNLWPAIVDPTQMELAMLNRAINARDAMEVGGTLTIETANVTLLNPTCPEDPPTGDYVMVAIADTGTGIPPEVLDKVFERFFTTKEVGKGSGLGLAQVYGFAKQSGGGVHIDTRLGTGTTVKVYLPRSNFSAAQGSDSADTRRSVEPGTSSGGSVLVVDDDSAVREVTTAILEDLGYETLEAESGKAALAVLDREPHQQIDLLVLDFAMPGMNGAKVAREARRRRPNVPILFVTGFAEQAELMLAGDEQIMAKPFRDYELGRTVNTILAQSRDSSSMGATP